MTDTPGGRVPVQLTGMGKIVPCDDWKALGEGIVEVLSDRARFVRPVEEIERHFSVEETVRRYEELFRLYAVAAEERAARAGDPVSGVRSA